MSDIITYPTLLMPQCVLFPNMFIGHLISLHTATHLHFGVMMKSEPPGQFNRGRTRIRGRFTSLEPEPSNFYPALHTSKCTHYDVTSEEICWHDIIDHLMDKQIVLHKPTDAEDEDFAHT